MAEDKIKTDASSMTEKRRLEHELRYVHVDAKTAWRFIENKISIVNWHTEVKAEMLAKNKARIDAEWLPQSEVEQPFAKDFPFHYVNGIRTWS